MISDTIQRGWAAPTAPNDNINRFISFHLAFIHRKRPSFIGCFLCVNVTTCLLVYDQLLISITQLVIGSRVRVRRRFNLPNRRR